MPDLNLLCVTITEADFTRTANFFRRWLRRPSSPLGQTSPERLTLALVHSIEYLLSDRITDGIGKGGWGHSDRAYMECLYGPETASRVNESVMTTVVVAHAIHDCLLGLEKAGILIKEHSPRHVLDTIVDELGTYLRDRWDARRGHGGALVAGREGDFTLTPRYRHTAWLFCLWQCLPKYRDRTQLTALNLLEEFEMVKWEEETVATDVAAYVAFCLLENDPLCGALGVEAAARVRYFKHVIEGQMGAKFSSDLSGWSSGDALAGGRQLYTLFLIAEMTGMFLRPKDTLTMQMVAALDATMSEEWRSADGVGVPLKQGGKGDISASALAASALMRKGRLTGKERELLVRVVSFLIERLAGGQESIRGTFSWALSYFVRDISRYLAGDER